jgi:hypothetical protein
MRHGHRFHGEPRVNTAWTLTGYSCRDGHHAQRAIHSCRWGLSRGAVCMAEERPRRRLAAILSADVVGYSRLMGIYETGTLARLKAMRRDRPPGTAADGHDASRAGHGRRHAQGNLRNHHRAMRSEIT